MGEWNMSAFVIDKQTMDRVVSGICAKERVNGQVIRRFSGLDTTIRTNGTEIGRRLFTLNIEAVTQRYGDDDLPGPCDVNGKSTARLDAARYVWAAHPANDQETMIRSMKAMQCLSYQCAEGDVPERAALYRELKAAIGELAEAIVEKMPTYSAAPWG